MKSIYNRFTKSTILATLALILLSGCANTSQQPAPTTMLSKTALESVLANGDRSVTEKLRDQDRKPADVIEFLGIKSGMTVIDLIAAGGYYTEVLAYAVGPTGKVYSQNPAFVLKMRDGINDKTLTARLSNNRLQNVIRLDRPSSDLGIEPNSLDAAFTALNLHDIYNRSHEDAKQLLQLIKTLLKSGGTLGIIDHNGNAGADNASLHRMELAQAVALAEEIGFEISTSDLLANPKDDKTTKVWAPAIRGKTDRFILKLTKK